MENASKALIIAGAILISILLIGIGMMVFGNISGITGGAQQEMDSMQIQMFNDKFSHYEGTNVSGSNVKSLINVINSNNASTTDESRKITFNTGSVSAVKDVQTNARYTVTFTPNNSGFYTKVSITKN